MSMQYFKNLIDIQQLPKVRFIFLTILYSCILKLIIFFQNPPNFLVQSDLENYETIKVTVYNSERDSIDGQSDIQSDTVSDIIDLTETNGSSSPDPAAIALQIERYN